MNRNVNDNMVVLLDYERIMIRLGYARSMTPPGNIRSRVNNLILEIRAYIEPKAVYVDASIEKKFSDYTIIEGGLKLPGNDVARRLANSYIATIFAATLGEEITKQITQRSKDGRTDEAYILDVIASEAAEELARTVNRNAFYRARMEGSKTTGRFSPGYGDLPLEIQQSILDFTQAEKIGMFTNKLSMIFPRKSVTGVIGWYEV